jgi:cysteinyl-tRNA synthetase
MPYVEKFLRGLNNDLNTAEAISIIHELLNDNTADPKDKLATILDFDKVLGLDLQKGRENALKNPEVNIPESVLILVEERKKARANKDWKKSDDLRMLIEKMGFAVKDSGDESIVSPI